MTQREQDRQRATVFYQENLRALRRNFSGFDARNGYILDKPKRKKGERARTFKKREQRYKSSRLRVARYKAPLQLLRQTDSYPHKKLVRSKSPKKIFRIAEQFAPITLKGHVLRQVPIFTSDPKARIKATKDGALRITENGVIRDVYKFSAEKLETNPKALYEDIKTFMRKKRTGNITFNLRGNVIAQVYSAKDFDPESTTARFVNMVNRYRYDRHAGKYQNFIDAIGGISVYRGSRRGIAMVTAEIDAARAAAKQRRKQTKRALMTGRR